jgi:hypothetical protein
MDGRIGLLHCRYRVPGPPSASAAGPARLQQLALGPLLDAYAAALDAALGDDTAVYVLRRVDVALTLAPQPDQADAEIAGRWGRRMAGAVLRSVAHGTDELVRFADQADYVAQFINSLLHDQARECWFYGAFAHLLPLPKSEAVRRVLLENRPHLGAILGNLQAQAVLDPVLALLGPAGIQAVWAALTDNETLDAVGARPFFAAALRLADRLLLWTGAPAGEAALASYLATHPAAPDWRDHRALAATLRDLLADLRARGYLRDLADPVDPPVAARLTATLAELDWLDSAWLRDQLLNLFAPRKQAAPARPDPASIEPLLAAAWRLIDALALWAAARPEADVLAGFAPALAAPPDWRDKRGLTALVAEAIRFLAARGYLCAPDDPRAAGFAARLDAALADLDWLDTNWLRGELLALLRGAAPARPAPLSPTPLQQRLLDAIQAAVRHGDIPMERGQFNAPANALRLYALLRARHPEWTAEDAEVMPMLISRLFEAATWIAAAPAPPRVLRRLHGGDADAALSELPAPAREPAAASFRLLTRLGSGAVRVIEDLLSRDDRASLVADYVASGCAGVGLLARAVLDLQLTGLLASRSYPAGTLPGADGVQAVLLALGLRWAGAVGVIDGQLDPGLRLLAGVEHLASHPTPPSVAAFKQLWTAAWPDGATTMRAAQAGFQAACLRALVGQRLVQTPAIHLHQMRLPTGDLALILSDDSAALWPLGRIAAAEEVQDVVAEWLALWVDIHGRPPAWIVADAPLAGRLPARAPIMAVGVDSGGELEEAHRAGQERLAAALAAVHYGRLGLPEVDLTLDLLAIALLRLWARWLRQFGGSSVPYLLTNFVRRPGRIYSAPGQLTLELPALPLDIVLEMAGYTATLARVPWLGGRHLHFTMGAPER